MTDIKIKVGDRLKKIAEVDADTKTISIKQFGQIIYISFLNDKLVVIQK